MSDDQEPQGTLIQLGRRVRRLREERRLTQEEFARRAGISVSFASLLERGGRSPSYETLLKAAEALSVPLADLFRDGATLEVADPSHARLVDFARRTHLSRAQVDRFIAVGAAMFGVELEKPGGDVQRCATPGCERPVLAKGLCAPHYHRERRARLQDEA